RGYKKSLRTIVDLVAEHADDPTNNPIFMSHAGCPEVLEDLIGMLKERFSTKQIVSSYIGPVIGAHIGPGTVAVYFVGAERGDKRV
ncbi:MAG: DegV family protein, partial [Coriobacteriia bacterium]|nr:DegV family protein [Coriobacteriia bacterium]